MDPQKPAASRIRHILQAMERSIDAARSRRVGPLAASEPPMTSERIDSTIDAPRQQVVAAPPSATAQTYAARPHNGQVMIGAPVSATPSQAPVTRPGVPQLAGDGQPPRLKAKPKRFEGNLNSQFSPPPAYRSQAG